MSALEEIWPGPLPTVHDVYAARRVIAPHLPRTPLIHAPALDRLLGARVYVKCENTLPTGAFKVRGGINLVSRLSPDERRRGVITASTGNHGQSIAYAARMFGVRAIIGAPRDSNPIKVASMRALGAEVVLEGRDFDEAREWVERTARQEGYRYVHSANEPLLIAGVGTISLEVLEDLPEVDVIIAPIGAGSGACATKWCSLAWLRRRRRLFRGANKGVPFSTIATRRSTSITITFTSTTRTSGRSF